jgi:hypothetical protein
METPTPSLLPCLSLLSTHLTHLIPSLPRVNSNSVYRSIANNISTSLVDRVIMAGGAHRFSERGAQRFRQDVVQGWMSVVTDVASSESARIHGGDGRSTSLNSHGTALGKRLEVPWKYILDASLLLSLSSRGDESHKEETVTLDQACKAAFDQHGTTWSTIRQKLTIDDRMDLRMVQEILRRRIDCPR